jgi:hypothetical protein
MWDEHLQGIYDRLTEWQRIAIGAAGIAIAVIVSLGVVIGLLHIIFGGWINLG